MSTRTDLLKTGKKLVAVDFDGVIHSYTSGWKGPCVIPDPPVPGALDFLRELIDSRRFRVCIYSSRSWYWGGRRAMKRWLIVRGLGSWYVGQLEFPRQKPPAHVLIDDRAIQFRGVFPSLQGLVGFRPWNQRVG